MSREGFIKDYRKELDSDIWIMPPLYHRVWQYLKYEANHTENEIPLRDGTTFLINKGQKLTSYRGIARAIGWYEGLRWREPNPKTIKNICDWLEKNNMITQEHGKGNKQYTLVTIVNWGIYQVKRDEGVTLDKQESNTQVTAEKQLVDINKNVKNVKNDNKDNIPYKEIIDYLNLKAGTKYKYSTKPTQEKIKARWNEKFTLNDFKKVVDNKVSEWKDTDMQKYLRPETLFGTKFEGYLNQGGTKKNEPGYFDKADTKASESKYAGYKPQKPDTSGVVYKEGGEVM